MKERKKERKKQPPPKQFLTKHPRSFCGAAKLEVLLFLEPDERIALSPIGAMKQRKRDRHKFAKIFAAVFANESNSVNRMIGTTGTFVLSFWRLLVGEGQCYLELANDFTGCASKRASRLRRSGADRETGKRGLGWGTGSQ